MTPSRVNDVKTASYFEFPDIKADKKYNAALQKFMLSFKNIYSPNINASNLMFLTGPTKCGKSYLLH